MALVFAGRQAEAVAAIEEWARYVYRGNRPGKLYGTQGRSYVLAFNETYDPDYREVAAVLLGDLARAGLEVAALCELYNPGVGDERATEVLCEHLAKADYLPLRRDIMGLLGMPWAKPVAAPALAEAFRKEAESQDPSRTSMLVASAASRSSGPPDESALDLARSLANDDRFGGFRACFVWSLGNMRGEPEKALAVLKPLLEVPDISRFVTEALKDLGTPAALALLKPRR